MRNYANFSGRARRSEYWFFFLFYLLAYVVASIVDAVIGVPVVTLVVALGLLVPSLAVGVRRLHDIGKSGWFLLVGLIPLVGSIILIVWACTDGEVDNRYGPNPKHLGAGPAYA